MPSFPSTSTLRRSAWRAIAAWLLAALILVLVDLWVRGPFVRDYLAPRVVAPQGYLRDRTQGQAWSVLFAVIDELPKAHIRIGLLGDSTAYVTGDVNDDDSLAHLLTVAVRARKPISDSEVVDLSQIGVLARDAMLIAAKAASHDVDFLVYGVTLRVFPNARPSIANVAPTRITHELTPGDVIRIVRSGGGTWLRENLSIEDLLDSALRLTWRTYAHRAQLKQVSWEIYGQPFFKRWPPLEKALAPRSVRADESIAPSHGGTDRYRWSRDRYGMSNASWAALEILTELCRREFYGRCLIYASPLNPLSDGQLVDPVLHGEFLATLQNLVEAKNLHWLDLTTMLPSADFIPPKFGGMWDPIHLSRNGGTKLASRLADTLEQVLPN